MRNSAAAVLFALVVLALALILPAAAWGQATVKDVFEVDDPPFDVQPPLVDANPVDIPDPNLDSANANEDDGEGAPYDGLDDWENVFNGTDGALVSLFINEPNLNDNIFTGGGSKDDLDITQWACTVDANGAQPDKDNLLDGFAAVYEADGQSFVFFGLDRFANNGDAQVGFWLFKSPVGCNLATGMFEGVHQIGDLLILSDFTNGGRIGTVRIFLWDPTNPAAINGTLVEIFPTGRDCDEEFAGDIIACGNSNTLEEPSPWPYTPKFGTAGFFPPGSFYEGGVNLTELALLPDVPPGGFGCFSTFLVETRASASVDAALKDFILGNFETCGVEIRKDGPDLSKVGDDVTYDFEIENTGLQTLYLDEVIDDVLGDITAEAIAAGCDVLDAGETCSFSVDYTVAVDDPDPLVNEVTATYNEFEDLSGTAFEATDDHSTPLFEPSVEISKSGPDDAKVGDEVTYDFTIENTSSSNSPDLILDAVDDNVLGDLTSDAAGATPSCSTLAPGDTCSFSVAYTIGEGDPDPLDNQVTADYHPEGFPNDVDDTDNHSLDVLGPQVQIVKTGPSAVKAGDDATYDFTITNTGDAPLTLVSVTDTVLGDLTATAAGNGCTNLAPSGSCSFSASRTVEAGDPDPLVNTVTAVYNVDGFTNDVQDDDDHSLDVVKPGVEIVKTGPDAVKAGDDATYDFTITNTGDAPITLVSVTDTLLGDLATEAAANGCTNLAVSGSCSFSTSRTVEAGDPDPLGNTATAVYNVDGFPNDVQDDDSHSLDVVKPDVEIVKTGPSAVKAGDDATYDFTITNTGDAPITLVSVTDTLLGDLATEAAANGCTNLAASGGSCSFSASRTVEAGDPDPLGNTVTAVYNVDGFVNNVQDDDSHSLDVIKPGIEIAKTGPSAVKAGDDATYDFTITNTGDAPVTLVSVTDTLLGDLSGTAGSNGCTSLAASGGSCSFSASRTVLAGDPDPLGNTVTAVYNVDGFPNDVQHSDSHSLDVVKPGVDVVKTGPAAVKAGDEATYNYTITNTGDATITLISALDDLLGDLTADAAAAGCSSLAPSASCGFSAIRTVLAGDPDPLGNTITVLYNVDGFSNNVTDADSHSLDVVKPGVMITKDGPGFAKVGDTITYDFQIANLGDAPLNLLSVSDTVLGDISAAAGAGGCGALPVSGSCSFSVDYTVGEADPDPLQNVVTAAYNVTGFVNNVGDDDSHSVTILEPSFTVSKSCLSDPVPPGSAVQFRIRVENTGDVALITDVSDATLGIDLVDLELGTTSGACTETDFGNGADPAADAADGCLEVEGSVIAGEDDVTNEVFVQATLPAFTELPNVLDDSATSLCEVEAGGATRTLGYWRTHGSDGTRFLDPVEFGFTCHIAEHGGFPIDLGWKSLEDCADVFGIFWSSPSRESNGSRRDRLCRTKLHASWQLLAAILNTYLDNGAPVPDDPENPGTSIIDALIAELGGEMDRQEIIRLAGLLGAYNESGDDEAIVVFDGHEPPPADPNGTRDFADYTEGDCAVDP